MHRIFSLPPKISTIGIHIDLLGEHSQFLNQKLLDPYILAAKKRLPNF